MARAKNGVGIWLALASCVWGEQISVTSLNLAREADVKTVAEALLGDSVLRQSDVLLFQEVVAGVGEAVAQRIGYFVVEIPSSAASPDQGLAILSRFPVDDVKVIPLKRYNLRFHSRVRFAVAATARTPMGPVRVWNVHLDSRINPEQRVEQLAPVLEDATSHSGMRVVGGDLNTTKFQWFLNVLPVKMGHSQVEKLRGAFEKAGFRTPLGDRQVTFPFLSQHLDWFFANGLIGDAAGVVRAPFSDHHAVWGIFRVD